jgi:hypothetical protein
MKYIRIDFFQRIPSDIVVSVTGAGRKVAVGNGVIPEDVQNLPGPDDFVPIDPEKNVCQLPFCLADQGFNEL